MKKSYILCLFLSIFCFQLAQAQVYNLNSSGLATCPGNPGISADYDCAFDGGGPLLVGNFTDTNPPATILNSLEIISYIACDGGYSLILNGTVIASGTQTGTTCNCEPHTSPNVPDTLVVTITPAVLLAYSMGGNNTLMLETMAPTPQGAMCFYGADVIVNQVAGPPAAAAVPTLSQWGMIVFILLFACAGTITLWRQRFSMGMG